MSRYTGSHRGCCPTHRQGEGKLCVGKITFAIKRERRSGATASTPGSTPRPARKASRQPGCTPKAPGPPPAPEQREPRTAPWTAEEAALRPLAAGPVSVRSRPPTPPPPLPQPDGLAPFADSGGSVSPSGGSSGLPRPARHLAPVPAPCSALTPPSARRAVPRRSPAERERRAPAGSAEPSRGPGRSIAAPGGGAGPAHGASGAGSGGGADRSTPRPPRPRAARVLPGTPWSRRVPSGTKGRAAQWAR